MTAGMEQIGYHMPMRNPTFAEATDILREKH